MIGGLNWRHNHRRFVEEAKSHGRGCPGMMAGGTHRDKGILGAAAHDFIDCRRGTAHAMRDRREAFSGPSRRALRGFERLLKADTNAKKKQTPKARRHLGK